MSGICLIFQLLSPHHPPPLNFNHQETWAGDQSLDLAWVQIVYLGKLKNNLFCYFWPAGQIN